MGEAIVVEPPTGATVAETTMGAMRAQAPARTMAPVRQETTAIVVVMLAPGTAAAEEAHPVVAVSPALEWAAMTTRGRRYPRRPPREWCWQCWLLPSRFKRKKEGCGCHRCGHH